MIIKTLQIHNMASIVDATIPFGDAPLSTSPVFLISGKTGAGKSTILDCICLALYNHTPRMDAAQSVASDDSNLKNDDVRQILRRGTGIGTISLTFTGNDAHEYLAEWTVRRAREKPDGRFQRVSWIWTDFTSNEKLSLQNEIIQRAQRVIGLDFQQFCRTTLLAQGEFTKFLNSDDNDKALILEKILGTEIYARVGRKIFEHYSQATQTWQRLSDQASGIRLLSDEERQAASDRTHELRSLLDETGKALTTATAQRDWLKKQSDLEQEVAQRHEALTRAEEAQGSEENLRNQLLVADWEASDEARTLYTRRQQAHSDGEEAARRLGALRQTYQRLLNGLAFHGQWLENQQREKDRLDAALEQEEPLQKVYDACGTLTQLLADWQTELRQASDEAANQTRRKGEIDGQSTKVDQQKALLDDCQTEEKKQEADRAEAEKAVAAAQLAEKRTEKDRLMQRRQDIQTALNKVETLGQKRQQRQDDEAEQQRMTAQRDEAQRTIGELQQQIHDSDLILREKQDHYDKLKTANQHSLGQLRATLQKDDVCPLCRQTIRVLPPQDSELKRLFRDAETELCDAKKHAEELSTALARQKALLETATTALDRLQKKLADDHELQAIEADLRARCQQLGADADAAKDSLMQLNAENDKSLDMLKKAIDEGEQLETMLKALQKKADGLRKKRDKLQKKYTDERDRLTALQTQQQKSQALEQAHRNQAADKAGQLGGWLDAFTWPTDWRQEPETFAASLRQRAASYTANGQEQSRIGQQLTQGRDDHERMEATLRQVAELQPTWDNHADAPSEVANLSEAVTTLAADIRNAMTQQTDARRREQEADIRLKAIQNQKPQLSDGRIGYLMLQAGTMKDVKQKVDALRTAERECRARWTDAKQRLAQHTAQRPEMPENTSQQQLQPQIDALTQRQTEANQELGAVMQQFREDEKNRKTHEQQMRQVEAAQAECDKWKALKDLAGDSEGKNFRKIAESYVLGALVEAANSYMRSLTDRYLLSVMPGTFLIMLEDLYQYGDSRPSSTLSGGESFLVSLALALALSDIGNQSHVNMLFIDEGFGTLSGEPLENAINTLRGLNARFGRHVGIISHVEELKERIDVQVRVEQPQGQSESRVEVVAR
jgi:exonuclease SbcC